VAVSGKDPSSDKEERDVIVCGVETVEEVCDDDRDILLPAATSAKERVVIVAIGRSGCGECTDTSTPALDLSSSGIGFSSHLLIMASNVTRLTGFAR
jgi:hypothetical protein